MPKSCVNFQPVKDIERSLKHVHRKEEREPSHLLPKEHRRANFRVVGSLTPPQVRKRFEKRIANQTGQARSRENSSPFWEGVLLLDAPTDPHHDWSQAQAAKLRNWAKRYAEMTGHEVVQIQVHADEGYMLDGKPVYNGHAHVYVDRCNTEGRIISLSRTAMSRVQDMTAEVMGLERGETLDDRKGYRGRKHLTPNQWRDAANRAKEVGLELFEKGRAAGVAATAKIAIQEAQEASGRAERHEWYIHLRGVLKAHSGPLRATTACSRRSTRPMSRSSMKSAAGPWTTTSWMSNPSWTGLSQSHLRLRNSQNAPTKPRKRRNKPPESRVQQR